MNERMKSERARESGKKGVERIQRQVRGHLGTSERQQDLSKLHRKGHRTKETH